MIYMVVWVALAILVGMYAYRRGHSITGVLAFLVLGLVFSPLVAFIAAALILPSEELLIEKGLAQRCPHCAELVKPAASVCSHCGRDIMA
ncbi:MAG: zinc ribbon domain-containing protein [Thiohalocapsa sp.]